MSVPPWGSLRAPLLLAAREAGAIIRDHWRRPRKISFKGPIDLVTETDVAVEAFLRQRLTSLVPEAVFIGEESGGDQIELRALDRPAWIVDPLDGTTNFAHRLPFVATSIGLYMEGRVRLGVVFNPIMDELFWAEQGHGAFCNDERMQVSEREELLQCVAATGFPYSIRKNIAPVMACLEDVLTHCRAVRRYGAAALDLAYVAWGRLDFFYEGFLHPWDVAAGWLLVEEAGGRVTQMASGKPYVLDAPTLLASNGRVHDAATGLLAGKGLEEAVILEKKGT